VTSAKPEKKSRTECRTGTGCECLPIVVNDDGRTEFGQPTVDEDLKADHDHHGNPVRRTRNSPVRKTPIRVRRTPTTATTAGTV